MKQQLFFDCDGVLADFDLGFYTLFGHWPDRANPSMTPAHMWKSLEDHRNFYGELNPTPEAFEIYEAFRHMRPIILTGIPYGTWAAPQKLEWRDRNFPGTPMVTCLSMNKRLYCIPGDILVDDHLPAKEAWEEAGGIFIHHTGDAKATIAKIKEAVLMPNLADARIVELEAALAEVREDICREATDTLWRQKGETVVDFISHILKDEWDYDKWLAGRSKETIEYLASR